MSCNLGWQKATRFQATQTTAESRWGKEVNNRRFVSDTFVSYDDLFSSHHHHLQCFNLRLLFSRSLCFQFGQYIISFYHSYHTIHWCLRTLTKHVRVLSVSVQSCLAMKRNGKTRDEEKGFVSKQFQVLNQQESFPSCLPSSPFVFAWIASVMLS